MNHRAQVFALYRVQALKIVQSQCGLTKIENDHYQLKIKAR